MAQDSAAHRYDGPLGDPLSNLSLPTQLSRLVEEDGLTHEGFLTDLEALAGEHGDLVYAELLRLLTHQRLDGAGGYAPGVVQVQVEFLS